MTYMTHRERLLAVLNYEKADRIPVVHFGFWGEALQKWVREGHITAELANTCGDGTPSDRIISEKIGFDYNYFTVAFPKSGMGPLSYNFEQKKVGETPDGFELWQNPYGVIEKHRGDAGSIPAEVDHVLKNRTSWEEHFLPRMQFSEDRIDSGYLQSLKNRDMEYPLGIYCGSMYGTLRDFMGVEGISYLYADDEDLFAEMIQTTGDLWYNIVKAELESGVTFDFAHFWEDICFKNGPLVSPSVFREYVLPQYKRITDLVKSYGIRNVSVDCDGFIDALIPVWLDGGVNTMFPIEYGTWHASIAPWREKYGKTIRGVGGMCKHVFEQDYAAVDAEIERLKPLIALGGYIPCPDHRITPEAKWENIQYYCEKLRKITL